MAIDLAVWVMYFVSIYFAVFWMTVILDNNIKDVPAKKSKKSLPKVSVTIPMFNEENSVVGTIESVLGLDYPSKKLQIILVNDCSTDNTHKVVQNFLKENKSRVKDFDIKYINHKVNSGKGVAMNNALKISTGDLFVCLDADSFVEPDALIKIAPYFEDENVASVLPLMKLKKVKGFALNLQYVEYLVNFFLKKVMGLLDCIHVTPGPFGVYSKKILQEVGGFDTDNLTEDLEMALRLQKRNYKIIQLIGAKVFTLAPEKMKGWFNQRNRWYKGTLINLLNYRGMFFNKKYGEFGMFHLPMVLGAAMISIFFAFFVMWKHMIKPLLGKIYDLSFINFNVAHLSDIWMERFSFLDINYMILFFTFVIFTFGIAWVVYAFRYTEETFTKKGLASTAMFMVIYPFFLSVVWLGVVLDLARGKKQKW